MSSNNDHYGRKEMWGCIGVVLAALITGFVTLIVAGKISLPWFSPTATPPASQVLNIRPACGSDYTVEAGKVIELHYGGWYAKGFALAANDATHLTVALFMDGQEISGTKQAVQQVTTSWYPGASCGSADYSDAFGTYYISNIGALTPGEHKVKVTYTFDTQVTDGYDNNNDGAPDPYGPGPLDPLLFNIVATP